ncbi:tyrosine-type recombinase/integrase [Glacieibacterium megasporae]|uniref:tyrosine-type recombinase/integrase n=1 Tax=Glacieibacterium megasporae TaxID=2835787 RepID=UPI001C1E65EA|nr:integrase arm-type DNA-binding domain-containing protein [Polymorphobacter megasporae]UAJ10689.1 integrase arm-type DNA-binding domain-containing protein [Polymorphobacter megasporae]
MLTVIEVKGAQPRAKDYKLADSGGLYLFITTKGHRSWRLKYRFGGKEHRMLLGPYPSVGLAEARQKRDEFKAALKNGRDPKLEQERVKSAAAAAATHTFEKVARDWFAVQSTGWRAVHASDVLTSLERDLFPGLGAVPIGDIDERMLLTALRAVEKRGAVETARRLRQRADAIFRYARSEGIPNGNPAAVVDQALAPLPPKKRWPAIVVIEDLRTLIRDVDGAGASPVTRLASRFLALTAQRPGMVRGSAWTEFEGIDWNDATRPEGEASWRVPAARMKLEFNLAENDTYDHPVPLSRQAVDVLRAVRLLTGRGSLAFCSSRDVHVPMSENSIGYLYHRCGYKGRHVPHGWRSSFSTIMNGLNERMLPGSDRSAVDRHVIDLMLAHTPSGISASELRYNRAAFMPRRREIAELWADLLMQGIGPAAQLMSGRRRGVGA